MKNSPGWKKRNITMVKIRWEFLQKITSDRLNQLRKWTSAILLLWEKTHDKKTRHDPIYLFTRLPPTFADTYQKAQHCKDAAGEGSKFYKWHRLRAMLCIKVVTGLTEGKKEKKAFWHNLDISRSYQTIKTFPRKQNYFVNGTGNR